MTYGFLWAGNGVVIKKIREERGKNGGSKWDGGVVPATGGCGTSQKGCGFSQTLK